MTSTEFLQSKYRPLAMPMPFGANDDGNYTTPGLVQSAASFNFLDGFPSAYSAPHSGGGKYVTRKEMNGIGNVASRYEFFRRVGGIVTFDPDFATAIGGYPKGAVLDYLDGLNVHKVYSAIDNNTVNFVTDGVDGVNWIFVNQDKGDIRSVLFSADSVPPSGNAVIGTFRATKTGPITPVFNVEKIYGSTSQDIISGPSVSGDTAYSQRLSGCSFLFVSRGSGTTPSDFPEIEITNNSTTQSVNWHGYTSLWGNFGYFLIRKPYVGNWVWTNIVAPPSSLWVEAGTWYGIYLAHSPEKEYVASTNIQGSVNTFTLNSTVTTISGSFTIYQ